MARREKATAALSAKGELLLPAALRRRHGWGSGTRFLIEETKDGVLLTPAPPPDQTDDLYASGSYTGPTRTIEEMNNAIAEHIRKRHESGRY